jgi:hypothetical protein
VGNEPAATITTIKKAIRGALEALRQLQHHSPGRQNQNCVLQAMSENHVRQVIGPLKDKRISCAACDIVSQSRSASSSAVGKCRAVARFWVIDSVDVEKILATNRKARGNKTANTGV